MWTPTPLQEMPQDWSHHDYVSIDIETNDPDLKKLGPGVRRGAYMIGYSLGFEDGSGYYVPIRHEGGGNLDCQQGLTYLRDNAKHFRGELIGANLRYDLDFLAEEGIEFNSIKQFRDIQLADPLINELHNSYSLKNIAARWGFEGKEESLLVEAAKTYGIDAKAQMYLLHSQYVGEYAVRDATLPLAIYKQQLAEIENQCLENVFELESRLMPVLLKMTRRGVAIDEDELQRVKSYLFQHEIELLKEIDRETGIKINSEDIWKGRLILPLFNHLGIDLPKTATGKPSIAFNVIKDVPDKSVQALIRARKLNKLRTTFCESIERFTVNGRIHCLYNQLKMEQGGAAFGRLSSEKPNLQQVPKRSAEGKLIRSIFIPDEGQDWVSIDYSAQEPRMAAHFAIKYNCRGVESLKIGYQENPRLDMHERMASITGQSRDNAKTIFLGLCYGMGGGKLAASLGLDYHLTPDGKVVPGIQAKKILSEFHKAAPYISKLNERCRTTAVRHGSIRTLSGRRCRFPKKSGWGYDFAYKALNRLIQGSAADQTKRAMVLADQEGIPLQLQVHDELIFSEERGSEQAETLQKCMVEAFRLEVPTICDIERKDRWEKTNVN